MGKNWECVVCRNNPSTILMPCCSRICLCVWCLSKLLEGRRTRGQRIITCPHCNIEGQRPIEIVNMKTISRKVTEEEKIASDEEGEFQNSETASNKEDDEVTV